MRSFLYLGLALMILSSCKKEEKSSGNTSNEDFRRAVWISNEGAFGSGNAEVSLIHQNGSISNNIFTAVNGFEPGDVMQSVHTGEEYAYLILNSSQKLVVVDQASLAQETVIAPLNYPRYALEVAPDRVYISNGAMAGEILILDLNAMAITGSIPVGNGPERMIKAGERIAVVNTGGWLEDQRISLIDPYTDLVVAEKVLSDRPIDLELGADGSLWVLCAGYTQYDQDWNITGHSDARLWKLDGSSLAELGVWTVGANGDHPQSFALSADAQFAYLALNGAILRMELSDPSTQEVWLAGLSADHLFVDPDSGELWVCDVVDYSSNGWVHRCSPDGTIQQSWQAGVAPNHIAFGALR